MRGQADPVRSDRILVVSWNVHVGSGDVRRLYADLRRAHADTPLILLLQEAFRGGVEVPGQLPPGARFAAEIRERHGAREEIESTAAALGLHGFYVPSMRNGPPVLSDEDRGNAILSTLPLTDLAAIELPHERQRRVAVAATVRGETPSGAPWTLRLASAHLDTMSGPARLWVAGGEWARTRQVRGLLAALDVRTGPPFVLGADLNTLFGFRDRAYVEALAAFPQTRVTDGRKTFMNLLRLDHLFFRLPDGWHAEFRRADDRYGSDHYPLVGSVQVR